MEQSSGRGFTPQNFREITPLRRPRGAALSAEAPVFIPKTTGPPMMMNQHDANVNMGMQNLSIAAQQPSPYMRQQHQQQQHQSMLHHYPNTFVQQQQSTHHLSQQQQQVLHPHHHHSHYQQQYQPQPHQQQPQQHQLHYHQLPHSQQQPNRPIVSNHHMQSAGSGGSSVGAYPKLSVQNRLSNHHPQQLNNIMHHQPNDDYMHNIMPSSEHKQTETESVALDFLTEVVMKLYDNPGMFEVYQTKLKQMFTELANNYFVISNAVELLFEQSISEQNFRYMGARLCNLLDDLDPSPDNQFRTLSRMKMTDQLQQLQQFMQKNEQHKVRGTTLFLAELYMQLRRPHDIDRNVEIGRWIISAFQLLLNRNGPENVKCVCQSLKLCGFELDLDCTEDMKGILELLKTFEDKIDVSTGRLVRSVLDLKGNRWGRSDTHSLPPVISELSHQEYSDSPVFYGPDGKIITEEESSFLVSNIPQYPNINFDELVDDSDDVIDDGEMDLEIQLAFKDFVQSAKIGHQNSK